MFSKNLFIFFSLSFCSSVSFLLYAESEKPTAEELLREPVVPEGLEPNLIPRDVPRTIPFKDGEKLNFKLGWSMFRVANAYLSTEKTDFQGRESLKYTLRTKTKGFVNAIYPVDSYSYAWTDLGVNKSYGYDVDNNEGGEARKKLVTIDWDERIAQYKNLLTEKEEHPVKILNGTFDPLSIVYYVRTLNFDVGDQLVIPTTNGKEFFFTIVNVTKKITRKFLSGKREAYVVEPEIKDLGGVFKKSEDGKVVFYFSADKYKFPLRMESEVAVGRFWAEMTTAEIDGELLDY